jgi:hypothetical protein
MNGGDDYWPEMSWQPDSEQRAAARIEEMLAEAELGMPLAPDVTGFLFDLAALAEGPAPAMTAALAELVDSPAHLSPLVRLRHRRLLLASAGAAAVLAAASGVAAASDQLPGPARSVITNVLNEFRDGPHRSQIPSPSLRPPTSASTLPSRTTPATSSAPAGPAPGIPGPAFSEPAFSEPAFSEPGGPGSRSERNPSESESETRDRAPSSSPSPSDSSSPSPTRSGGYGGSRSPEPSESESGDH